MIIDIITGEILDSPSPFGWCIFCGQITQDWWYMDRRTGKDCRCQSCYSLGHFFTREEVLHHARVNEIFRARGYFLAREE
jgi:hypothetical protein